MPVGATAIFTAIAANKADAKPVKSADICGRSCFGDRPVPEVRIPHLVPGDITTALDIGG